MLGVALLDLDDPKQVLYRSPDPIFIPKEDYELYGWAPIVVFANGAVARARDAGYSAIGKHHDRSPTVVFANGAVARARDAGQIIEDDDEILIYYGGGDRVVGVAWARLCDLAPEAARRCST